MLTFIGLGLYDLEDISGKGLKEIRAADYVFLETYTSCMMGTSRNEMEEYYGKPVRLLRREDVEQHPETFLMHAVDNNIVFLTGGDPMVSTTHIDLRIRAARLGIGTRIIHGASIVSAVAGVTGLQNYRFGKSCSLPFPHGTWCPTTPAEVILKNQRENLHTLVYLDIQVERFMTIHEAVDLLDQMSSNAGFSIPCYVGVARAGSVNPIVLAGTAEKMRSSFFGPPLHVLVVPGELHIMEREYLEVFAGYEH